MVGLKRRISVLLDVFFIIFDFIKVFAKRLSWVYRIVRACKPLF